MGGNWFMQSLIHPSSLSTWSTGSTSWRAAKWADLLQQFQLGTLSSFFPMWKIDGQGRMKKSGKCRYRSLNLTIQHQLSMLFHAGIAYPRMLPWRVMLRLQTLLWVDSLDWLPAPYLQSTNNLWSIERLITVKCVDDTWRWKISLWTMDYRWYL